MNQKILLASCCIVVIIVAVLLWRKNGEKMTASPMSAGLTGQNLAQCTASMSMASGVCNRMSGGRSACHNAISKCYPLGINAAAAYSTMNGQTDPNTAVAFATKNAANVSSCMNAVSKIPTAELTNALNASYPGQFSTLGQTAPITNLLYGGPEPSKTQDAFNEIAKSSAGFATWGYDLGRHLYDTPQASTKEHAANYNGNKYPGTGFPQTYHVNRM